MRRQLNMFEVEPTLMQFDASKARVKRGVGKVTYADVRVAIPRHAKSTDELPRTTSPDERYETFEQYTMGIWRFQRAMDKRFQWEAAEELCKAARDKKEIVRIRIYLGNGFKPDVVEYLQ
ncbi:cell division protein SepF [Bacillus cereus]|uniref:cell division protein SepF n=1 Tax=Bacillus cereus group TaxID=86661 RepID=UPI0027EA866D|nr:cell division protein SepF [Bacillus cereus]